MLTYQDYEWMGWMGKYAFNCKMWLLEREHKVLSRFSLFESGVNWNNPNTIFNNGKLSLLTTHSFTSVFAQNACQEATVSEKTLDNKTEFSELGKICLSRRRSKLFSIFEIDLSRTKHFSLRHILLIAITFIIYIVDQNQIKIYYWFKPKVQNYKQFNGVVAANFIGKM